MLHRAVLQRHLTYFVLLSLLWGETVRVVLQNKRSSAKLLIAHHHGRGSEVSNIVSAQHRGVACRMDTNHIPYCGVLLAAV
jgi:hypothetical protein